YERRSFINAAGRKHAHQSKQEIRSPTSAWWRTRRRRRVLPAITRGLLCPSFARCRASRLEQVTLMANTRETDVTALLQKWSYGDAQAVNEIAPLIYANLRRVAHRYLRSERPDHTLQSAELVHEAYLRMIDQTRATWRDRAHFFAVSAKMMRRI